jgi:hypothetical protein
MLLKKYCHHLIELSDFRLFFIRYSVNLILFVEMMLLPFILRPNFYAQMELLRNIFLIAPITLLGAHSGYLLVYYNQHKDYKNALLLFTCTSGLCLSFCVFFIFHNLLASAAVFFVLACNSVEKILIVEGRLIWASVYKSMVSLFMICICLGSVFFSFSLSSIDVYAASTILGISFWLILGFANTPCIFPFKCDWSEIRELISRGFYLNIQTYILLIYFLVDRYFINAVYVDHAAEYAISYSFSQIIFIALNTIAFSAQQKMGLNVNSIGLNGYNKLLRTTVVLYCVLLTISFIAVLCLAPFLSRYGDFKYSFIIISIFVGGYFTISSFSVLAFYKGLASKMMGSILLVSILNIAISYCFMKYSVDYYLNLIKSGFLLVLSALMVDNSIRKFLYEKL